MDARPQPQEALAATAHVAEESGRWVVYLDVILVDGAVRRRLGDYHDERRARLAARIIERNVIRSIPPAAPEPTR